MQIYSATNQILKNALRLIVSAAATLVRFEFFIWPFFYYFFLLNPAKSFKFKVKSINLMSAQCFSQASGSPAVVLKK